MAGGAKVSDELAQRLRDATEGNPFFTKELVRSLDRLGGIAQGRLRSAWSFSKATGIDSDALPATIQQAVEKRIERLPDELRELLSVASVLGRSFDFRDLEIAGGGREGPGRLDRNALVREGILEEERESRGDRLAFASGIVRDVLYGAPRAASGVRSTAVRRAPREALRRAPGAGLSRSRPPFLAGRRAEKTVEYGLKLAQKSLDAFSPDDAIRAAKTCLEFLEDDEWDGDRALEGEARLLVARRPTAWRAAPTALCARPESAAKVFEREKRTERAVAATLFAAETAWQERRVEETRRLAERGIEVAPIRRRRRGARRAALPRRHRGQSAREYSKAAAYLAEIERLAPSREGEGRRDSRGGSRSSWPWPIRSPTTDPGRLPD